jgi:hypothetical protein
LDQVYLIQEFTQVVGVEVALQEFQVEQLEQVVEELEEHLLKELE